MIITLCGKNLVKAACGGMGCVDFPFECFDFIQCDDSLKRSAGFGVYDVSGKSWPFAKPVEHITPARASAFRHFVTIAFKRRIVARPFPDVGEGTIFPVVPVLV